MVQFSRALHEYPLGMAGHILIDLLPRYALAAFLEVRLVSDQDDACIMVEVLGMKSQLASICLDQ